MKRLTDLQKDTLTRIRIIRDARMQRIRELGPEYKPTEWQNVHELVYTHKIPRRIIEALINKGILVVRMTDGFGAEVMEL